MPFRRLNVLPLVFLMLLVFLQYRLWFESGGMLDMARLKKQLAVEQSKNAVLKKHNQALMLQVRDLRKSPDAVESRARQELGMVKKGEIFYQVVK